MGKRDGLEGDAGQGAWQRFDMRVSDPDSPAPNPAVTTGPGGGGEPGSHLESIRRAGRARAPGPAAEGGGELGRPRPPP